MGSTEASGCNSAYMPLKSSGDDTIVAVFPSSSSLFHSQDDVEKKVIMVNTLLGLRFSQSSASMVMMMMMIFRVYGYQMVIDQHADKVHALGASILEFLQFKMAIHSGELSE